MVQLRTVSGEMLSSAGLIADVVFVVRCNELWCHMSGKQSPSHRMLGAVARHGCMWRYQIMYILPFHMMKQ